MKGDFVLSMKWQWTQETYFPIFLFQIIDKGEEKHGSKLRHSILKNYTHAHTHLSTYSSCVHNRNPLGCQLPSAAVGNQHFYNFQEEFKIISLSVFPNVSLSREGHLLHLLLSGKLCTGSKFLRTNRGPRWLWSVSPWHSCFPDHAAETILGQT